MCGIAGLFQRGPQRISREQAENLVKAMTDSIVHRGPDASGLWTDDKGACTLGHRRLAIIDITDAGRQPFASADGRWMITFNGEIYNFATLRTEMEAEGFRARGRTDTEILIEGFARQGPGFLKRLDGMFAFAAYDTLDRTLWLARDPFGEKPLYYTKIGDLFAFASELQALEKLPNFNFEGNIDAVAEVLSFQYIGAPRTIYQHTHKLPTGSWMRIDADGAMHIQRYFNFTPAPVETARSMSDLADELEEILVKSLRGRLISDVPLGAFLSGGVDSSTVCALIRKRIGVPLKTYSIGFTDAPESEHEIARAFAAHIGSEHHEKLLSPQGADFLFHAGDLLDEPNADSSCLPTYLLSQFAREQVTVAISGDGGDEMLGGYGRYFSTLDDAAAAQPGFSPGDTYYADRILVATEPHIQEVLGFVPAEYAAHLKRLRTDINDAPHLLAALRRTDVDNYMPGAVLPKVDRMSMRHALEVRTPFLNVDLARFVEKLPDRVLVQGGRGKALLREVSYRYLPADLIDRPKQGFGLPMADWARESLLGVAGKLLDGEESRLRAAFGADGIDAFLQRQRTDGRFSAYQVWAVAMLEAWLRKHPARFDDVPRAKTDASRRTTPPDERTMHFVSIRNGVFIAAEGPQDSDPEQTVLDAFKDSYSMMSAVNRYTGKGDFQHTKFSLPKWTRWAQESTLTPVVRDGAVILLNEDVWRNFGRGSFDNLSALGFTRALMRYPTDSYLEVSMQRLTPAQRRANVRRLSESAIATFGRKPLLGVFTQQGSEVVHVEGEMWRSIHLPALQGAPDTEMNSTYLVFENDRQMPPIPGGHQQIVNRGDGRNSIWNEHCYFSPMTPGAAQRAAYFVSQVDKTDPDLLEMLCREVSHVQAEEQAPTLSGVVAAKQNASFTPLKPGDRVVVFTHALPPGGAERQWVLLAQTLKEMGYEVTFVVNNELTGRDGHYLPHLEAAGIPVRVARDLSLLQLRYSNADIADLPIARRLVEAVAVFDELKPKVIFAALDESNLIAGIAAHMLHDTRAVLSFRNYNPSRFSYLDTPWYQPAYAALAQSPLISFSGNCTDANNDYADWIGMPRANVTLTPNAICAEMFPPPTPVQIEAVRAELSLTKETPVVLGVFRLSEEKEPFAFVDTCARIAARTPDAVFLVAGVGPLEAQIAERAAAAGLSGRFRLLGRRSDVNALMGAASLLLLTSKFEGMPNAVMEAQFVGLPVVATDAGATRETSAAGLSSFIRPIGDVAGLAEDCLRILSDPALAARMGEAGKEHVRAFTRQAMAQRFIDVANKYADRLAYDAA